MEPLRNIMEICTAIVDVFPLYMLASCCTVLIITKNNSNNNDMFYHHGNIQLSIFIG